MGAGFCPNIKTVTVQLDDSSWFVPLEDSQQVDAVSSGFAPFNLSLVTKDCRFVDTVDINRSLELVDLPEEESKFDSKSSDLSVKELMSC